MLVGILLSVLGEVRVAPTALLSLAETTWILDNTIKCDQGRQAELPHPELLACARRIFQQRRAVTSTTVACICTAKVPRISTPACSSGSGTSLTAKPAESRAVTPAGHRQKRREARHLYPVTGRARRRPTSRSACGGVADLEPIGSDEFAIIGPCTAPLNISRLLATRAARSIAFRSRGRPGLLEGRCP